MKPAPLVVEHAGVQLGDFRLDDVSFRVEPGQVTALLGHNGAGKTTLLSVIMGLVRADTGRLRLGNLDHLADEKEFKRRIGFVPEESYFYGRMTVAAFVDFVSAFYEDWDAKLCRELAQTLDLPQGRRIEELSKGMRTKLRLLVSLSHRPEVLLLDEPTSGLDPRSRVVVLKLLERAAHDEGRAVLFSTHNLHEIEKIASHWVILDHGRVLADENLAALRLQSGGEWSLENYYLEQTQ